MPRYNLQTVDIMPGTMCPRRGMPFEPNEATTQEGITPKHGKQETRIIKAKPKKKYYDEKGNEINDEQLIKDIANGTHVISYHEEKQGPDVTIDKQTRRIIRTRK
jgi:hypothetical protein